MKRIEYVYNRSIYDMLPSYYRDYVESASHVEASDEEFARMYAELSDVVRNTFVASADWALDHYAKLYGIEHESDKARWINLSADRLTWKEASNYTWGEIHAMAYRPSENLKERILAVMSAKEVASIPDLEDYAERITGYRIELVEFNEDYAMSIYLKDGEGSSLILYDIIELIKPLIPAHIALFISMLYLRWVEFDYINFNWEGFDAENVTWEDLEDKDVWSKWLN